jgi:hypothetical protein
MSGARGKRSDVVVRLTDREVEWLMVFTGGKADANAIYQKLQRALTRWRLKQDLRLVVGAVGKKRDGPDPRDVAILGGEPSE